jgi:hypothetical protein
VIWAERKALRLALFPINSTADRAPTVGGFMISGPIDVASRTASPNVNVSLSIDRLDMTMPDCFLGATSAGMLNAAKLPESGDRRCEPALSRASDDIVFSMRNCVIF